MMCLNGTVEDSDGSSSTTTTTTPATTTTHSTSTLVTPTSTNPTATMTTVPGIAPKNFGASAKIVAGLVLLQGIASSVI